MDMLGKVRRMRMRDKLSYREIAKRTGLARNTIRKWVKEPGDQIPKYRRSTVAGKLTEFEPFLERALKADRGGPAQLDSFSVFLSGFSAG